MSGFPGLAIRRDRWNPTSNGQNENGGDCTSSRRSSLNSFCTAAQAMADYNCSQLLIDTDKLKETSKRWFMGLQAVKQHTVSNIVRNVWVGQDTLTMQINMSTIIPIRLSTTGVICASRVWIQEFDSPNKVSGSSDVPMEVLIGESIATSIMDVKSDWVVVGVRHFGVTTSYRKVAMWSWSGFS